MVEQDEIVAVTDVTADPQVGGDEVIQPVEIPVGEPLTGQVADWQPALPLKGRKEIVVREPGRRVVLRIGMRHDAVEQLQETALADPAAKQGLKDRVVDAGKVLAN